jgi:hypothetical protein
LSTAAEVELPTSITEVAPVEFCVTRSLYPVTLGSELCPHCTDIRPASELTATATIPRVHRRICSLIESVLEKFTENV